MKSVPASLALVASVLSSITTAPIFAHSFTDNLDNVAAVAAAVQPVDNTAGGALTYRGESYFNLQVESNVQPNTAPNGASAGPGEQIQEGQPTWYPMDSSVLFFDQNSLAYACVTNAEEAAAATTCTIQVSEVRALDNITGVQELQCNPDIQVSPKVAMNVTTFPITFRGLKSVSTQVVQSSDGVDVFAVIDSNSYTAYSNKQFTRAWRKYN